MDLHYHHHVCRCFRGARVRNTVLIDGLGAPLSPIRDEGNTCLTDESSCHSLTNARVINRPRLSESIENKITSNNENGNMKGRYIPQGRPDTDVSYDVWRYTDKPPSNRNSKFRLLKVTKLPMTGRGCDIMARSRDCWVGFPVGLESAGTTKYRTTTMSSPYLASVVNLPMKPIEVFDITRDDYLVSLGWNRYQPGGRSSDLDRQFESIKAIHGCDHIRHDMWLESDTEMNDVSGKGGSLDFQRRIQLASPPIQTVNTPHNGPKRLDIKDIILESLSLFNTNNSESRSRKQFFKLDISCLKSPLSKRPMQFGFYSTKLKPYRTLPRKRVNIKYKKQEAVTDAYKRTIVKWGQEKMKVQLIKNIPVLADNAHMIRDCHKVRCRDPGKPRRILDKSKFGMKPLKSKAVNELKFIYTWMPFPLIRSTLYSMRNNNDEVNKSRRCNGNDSSRMFLTGKISPAFLTEVDTVAQVKCEYVDTELTDIVNASVKIKRSNTPSVQR